MHNWHLSNCYVFIFTVYASGILKELAYFQGGYEIEKAL